PERRARQSGFPGKHLEHAGVPYIEAALKEAAEHGSNVFCRSAAVLCELQALEREARIRLRRDFREPNVNAEARRERIHRARPYRLQVLVLRTKRRLRARPQLERHPFDVEAQSVERLGERPCREKAV